MKKNSFLQEEYGYLIESCSRKKSKNLPESCISLCFEDFQDCKLQYSEPDKWNNPEEDISNLLIQKLKIDDLSQFHYGLLMKCQE